MVAEGKPLPGDVLTRQREHFADLADRYVHARQQSPANVAYYDYYSRRLIEQAPNLGPSAVALDCMCGSGELSRILRSRVFKLHTADLSLPMLERADPAADGMSRTCADARALPYRGATFDAVFVRGGLHHVYRDHRQVLNEIFRVLRPGGWFVCSEPLDDNWLVGRVRRAMYAASSLFEPEDERGFSIAEITTAVAGAGFGNVSLTRFGYLAYALIGNTDVLPILRHMKSRRAVQWLIALDDRSPRVPLWRSLALACIVRGMKPAA